MTPVDQASFSAILRHLRLAAGLTQEDLAERAGLSSKAISGLERDPARLPRLDTVALLAEALGLDGEQRARLLAAARPQSAPPTVAPPMARLRLPPPAPLRLRPAQWLRLRPPTRVSRSSSLTT